MIKKTLALVALALADVTCKLPDGSFIRHSVVAALVREV